MSVGTTHLTDFLLGLTECESFRLSEVVGEKDTVMLRVRDRVVRRSRGEEVGGDKFGALMHELVERVLAVRSCRTPDNWLIVEL